MSYENPNGSDFKTPDSKPQPEDRKKELEKRLYQESTLFEKVGAKAEKACRFFLMFSLFAAAGIGIHGVYEQYQEGEEIEQKKEQEIHHGTGTVMEIFHREATNGGMSTRFVPLGPKGGIGVLPEFYSGQLESWFIKFQMNNGTHFLEMSKEQATSYKVGEKIEVDYKEKPSPEDFIEHPPIDGIVNIRHIESSK